LFLRRRKEINFKKETVFWEYLIERFSEVLNVHHHYSIFLLINVFSLMKYNNEETVNLFLCIMFKNKMLHEESEPYILPIRRGPTKTCYTNSRLRCILIEPDP
jgi:hypothetical protein